MDLDAPVVARPSSCWKWRSQPKVRSTTQGAPRSEPCSVWRRAICGAVSDHASTPRRRNRRHPAFSHARRASDCDRLGSTTSSVSQADPRVLADTWLRSNAEGSRDALQANRPVLLGPSLTAAYRSGRRGRQHDNGDRWAGARTLHRRPGEGLGITRSPRRPVRGMGTPRPRRCLDRRCPRGTPDDQGGLGETRSLSETPP